MSASQAVTALIDNANPTIKVRVARNHLHHIRAGQKADVTFRLYLGKTFPAKVDKIHRANPVGQLQPSALAPSVKEAHEKRFLVVLALDDPRLELPIGAAGTNGGNLYAGIPGLPCLSPVTLWKTTWLNFIAAG